MLTKPLKEAAEGRFAVEVRDGERSNCFLMIESSCCEARDMSAVWLEVRRRHSCDRRRSTYEDGVRGRTSTSCVVAKKISTKRKVGEKQAEAASLGGRSRSTKGES